MKEPGETPRPTVPLITTLVLFAVIASLTSGCKHCFREQRNLVDLPAECRLAPDPGPCEAAMPLFFFDVDVGDCKTFVWGGCDGAVPFATLEACEAACY